MDEKDPKDMTASKLLRHIARTVEDEECASDAITWLRMKAGTEEAPNYGTEMANALEAVANKIDAEIEVARMDARNISFWAGLDARIALFDYPRRKNETFDEWIERCFIQRPLDENGEPVQFGDSDIDWDEPSGHPGTAQWEATAVDCRGRLLATAFSGIVAVAKTDEHGRVKRLAPEVLGADGKPIVEGETVYPIDGDWIGDPLEVSGIDRDGSVRVSLPEGKGWTCYLAKYLDHTPPDTQARIDADARKYIGEYWGCSGILCRNCPVKVGGEKPSERYRTDCCSSAMRLDLLRRQRELDARKGGAE